jgi:hypothetical protein
MDVCSIVQVGVLDPLTDLINVYLDQVTITPLLSSYPPAVLDGVVLSLKSW